MTPGALRVWAALVVVYVVWGSTYLAMRLAVETAPPLVSAGLRFVTAGLLLGAILAARGGLRRLRVSRRHLASCALIGVLLLAGGNGAVNLAESGPPGRAVPSGVAALLIALVPLLVVLLRTVTGDRPPVATYAGVLVGFGGLVALVSAGRGVEGAVPVVGALIMLVAAASWATGSFLAGRLAMPGDPFVAAVYESLVGGLACVVIGLLRGESPDLTGVSATSWLALAYLLLAGSLVAFTAYVWLLHHVSISLVSTNAYVNPVVAVALGALVVAEPVTPAILVAGLVIIVGVVLVVSTEHPRSSGHSN